MIKVRLSSVNDIIIKPIAEGYGQGVGPTVGFAGFVAPPPPAGNIILLEDNVSYLMMEDNTSELLLEA